MNRRRGQMAILLSLASGLVVFNSVSAQTPKGVTPYAKVDITEELSQTIARMSAAKPEIMKRQRELLNQRYDMSNRADTATMSKGKPLQAGVRVKLPAGLTWDKLNSMSPEEIKEKDLFPQGFMPLPGPNHPEGGMLFPQFHIDAIKAQEKRDLNRFDLENDLPDHFLPEFPAPIYLTTHPERGDVSQGKLLTINNYYDIFKGLLNPKQIEGLRLLLTPFPQQQFNQTEDRRSVEASRGVSCLECHGNGHTNGSHHLVGDIRPQELRHRIETPSLRGVNVQRLFGSQRALKSVEDFTEFEQRAAYFDGDPVIATKKGVNILERGSQVHFMSEFMSILDFPPAPKLDVFGKLRPKMATAQELRGEAIFMGKGQCVQCHSGPYFTDNSMHDLQTERFFKPRMINSMLAGPDGKIKTFPLRGIKDSPPYMHDGRLLTLDDTVEFFNTVLETKLTTEEKSDLTAYLKAL